ncbi:MAG: carboxypeptidase-like regulatory domain-containing protein [Hyphomonas sp.]
MLHNALKTFAVGVACLCLTACVTRREFVLAPEASGIVIDAETGEPVEGAVVRHAGFDSVAPVVTGADGRFTLEGRIEKRTIVTLPMGGLFREFSLVGVAAPGRADGYASASYVSGPNLGRPPQARPEVQVLMFAADAAETPLHALLRDCIDTPEQAHALHIAGLAASIDPENPPGWFGEDTSFALIDHLNQTLPYDTFRSCPQMDEAYPMFQTQIRPLEAIRNAINNALLPPGLRSSP